MFRATRIPIRALFENLRDGASVEDFLEWFPGVPPQFIESVLEHEAALLKPAPLAENSLRSGNSGSTEEALGTSGKYSL